MAEWKTDRKPAKRQGGQAEDEAVPSWKSSPITQPHLTLPSIPRVPAVPSQRPAPPRARPSRQTGQQPVPSAGARRSGQTGQFPTLPKSGQRPGQTGQFPTLPKPERRTPARAQPSEQTGQPTSAKLPVPFGAGRSTGLIGRYAPPPGAERASAFARSQPSATQSGRLPVAVPPPSWPRGEAAATTAPLKAVTLIPGGEAGQAPQHPDMFRRARRAIPPRGQAVIIFCVLAALALGLFFGGVLKNGLEPLMLNYSASSTSGSAAMPTVGPTLPPGLNTTDINHYINKYGFDAPGSVGALAQGEQQRLTKMMPYALAATARYDARYQAHVEPQMLLWWTHAEGIGARINYSNCANESPPSGSFFVSIENCDRPDFWQLGYGNQFGNIWVLKDAFTDMHGNPDDPKLVQQVGQAVLDYDKSQHTSPACGGYSCTFPAMTIDQIMADVHWHAADHKETTSNWWASVLSRDPGINSYMLALALTHFSHEQTRTWVGCYYAEPCWQGESNAMWQILNAWKAMGG